MWTSVALQGSVPYSGPPDGNAPNRGKVWSEVMGIMMARATKRLLPPGAGQTPVERIETEQFARRLHKLMLDRGMSQSDLARKVWGKTTDGRGYDVAKNRDRISVYLRGQSYPDPVNLSKMADALGVPVEELAPDAVASAVERENPEVQMTAIAGHSDKVFLRVNKLVPMTVAAQIISLLSEQK